MKKDTWIKPKIERQAVLFKCPKCGYFSVAKISKEVLRNNRLNDSKKAPVRAFCPDPSGMCECKGGGRGKRQIRLVSRNYRHALARLPMRQKYRLDAVAKEANAKQALFEPNEVGTLTGRAMLYQMLDPSWVAGMEPPLAFRWERDI